MSTKSQACRCGRCGALYDRAELEALEPVRTLVCDEIAANVVHWPNDLAIDVRACAKCNTPIARTRRLAS